jgi:hypothetical protein
VSIESVALVLHHSTLSGTPKLVLLGIANHEGDGGAFPAIATLARYANVQERSVQRAIQEAVDAGELHVAIGQGRPGSDPRYRTNLYRVLVSCPPTCDGSSQHRVGVSSPSPLTRSRGVIPDTLGVTPTSPKPPLEPSIDQPLLLTETVSDLAQGGIVKPGRGLTLIGDSDPVFGSIGASEPNAGFAVWWEVYPRKVGKRAAEQAYLRARRRAPHPVLMAGARRYREDPNREEAFTAHPSTWLNRDGWLDEPLPHRATRTTQPSWEEALALAEASDARTELLGRTIPGTIERSQP